MHVRASQVLAIAGTTTFFALIAGETKVIASFEELRTLSTPRVCTTAGSSSDVFLQLKAQYWKSHHDWKGKIVTDVEWKDYAAFNAGCDFVVYDWGVLEGAIFDWKDEGKDTDGFTIVGEDLNFDPYALVLPLGYPLSSTISEGVINLIRDSSSYWR